MSATSTGDRPDLPVTNTIFPGALHDYIEKSEIKVLLLDVRDRDEFEREHIKGDAVVCLEPSVLTRDGYDFFYVLIATQVLTDSAGSPGKD